MGRVHWEFSTSNEKKRGMGKRVGEVNIGFLGDLGIEGLEPSRFLKSTDFPLTINFILVGIDMQNGTLSLFSSD